jgi:hypothetical protein
MKSIGSFMVILGIAAIVFGFMDRVPTILSWMYEWGTGPAWGIKIGLVVVGAVLYFMGSRPKQEVETPAPADESAAG